MQNNIFIDVLLGKVDSVECDPDIKIANNNFHIISDIIPNSNTYLKGIKKKYESLWPGDSYLLDNNAKLKNRATGSEDVVRIQKTVRKDNEDV